LPDTILIFINIVVFSHTQSEEGMKRYIYAILLVLAFSQCEKEFDPEGYGNFTDNRDGTEYKTVVIGSQTWLAENLKYLPEVVSPVNVSDSFKYYYVYDYYGERTDRARATTGYKTFGVLYNFKAAMDACPEGWHLPDSTDWENLNKFIGPGNGSELRSGSYWASDDNGNNRSGFNALPAGCQEEGRFRELGSKAVFWSTQIPYQEPGSAIVWGFHNSLGKLEYQPEPKINGYPVRCIKDSR
jgi:uncharacterized protein (TIGR02145 family)